MDELEQLKRVFLTDIDEETLLENQEKITEWEKDLVESEEYISWQEHPVTQKILKQATQTYIDSVIMLGKNRLLSDDQRAKLFGEQDASLWLVSLMAEDKKSHLESIKNDIRRAIDAT